MNLERELNKSKQKPKYKRKIQLDGLVGLVQVKWEKNNIIFEPKIYSGWILNEWTENIMWYN